MANNGNGFVPSIETDPDIGYHDPTLFDPENALDDMNDSGFPTQGGIPAEYLANYGSTSPINDRDLNLLDSGIFNANEVADFIAMLDNTLEPEFLSSDVVPAIEPVPHRTSAGPMPFVAAAPAMPPAAHSRQLNHHVPAPDVAPLANVPPLAGPLLPYLLPPQMLPVDHMLHPARLLPDFSAPQNPSGFDRILPLPQPRPFYPSVLPPGHWPAGVIPTPPVARDPGDGLPGAVQSVWHAPPHVVMPQWGPGRVDPPVHIAPIVPQGLTQHQPVAADPRPRLAPAPFLQDMGPAQTGVVAPARAHTQQTHANVPSDPPVDTMDIDDNSPPPQGQGSPQAVSNAQSSDDPMDSDDDARAPQGQESNQAVPSAQSSDDSMDYDDNARAPQGQGSTEVVSEAPSTRSRTPAGPAAQPQNAPTNAIARASIPAEVLTLLDMLHARRLVKPLPDDDSATALGHPSRPESAPLVDRDSDPDYEPPRSLAHLRVPIQARTRPRRTIKRPDRFGLPPPN